MAAKQKPYEQFGPYILFKKLESDALGDLWRAARIEQNAVSAIVGLRRLTGGNREAFVEATKVARQVAPLLTGPSFVRDQVVDVVNGVPFLAHDYAGGRSLRHIVDRARGGAGVAANPIPIDQALVIVERVALSLATIADLRFAGERLSHGALIPQFVWIADDGEIRVAAQQLGPGMVASLKDPKVGPELARYFSPEYQHSGSVTKASEVYSLGAMLYLTVTGHEPPEAASTSAFAASIRAAKTMAGTPIPDDVRAVMEKALNIDPAVRYATPGDMKQALAGLTTKYGATTFNLAFYISNLLKKEFESEAAERERESKLNLAAYVDAPAADVVAPAAVAAPMFATSEPQKKSKLPLAVAAAVILAAVGVGAYLTLGAKSQSKSAAPQQKLAASIPVKPPVTIVPEPIVASATPEATATTATTATTGTMDAEASKKAFEEAVNRKLHEELMKLQADYTRNLQQQQAKNAPVSLPPVVTTATHAAADDPSPAQLDEQRRDAARAAAAQVLTPAPAPVQTAAPDTAATQTVAAAPPVPVVHDGDVVDVYSLDVEPHRTRDPRLAYPPLAQRQRIDTSVLLSVLVSETGDVTDVKILRGDTRFGFNDAAVRAIRTAKFTPGLKNGKHVKYWFPQLVHFKP